MRLIRALMPANAVHIVLLLALLLTSACAVQPQQPPPGLDERVRQLEAENRFGAAAKLIAEATTEQLQGNDRATMAAQNDANADHFEQSVIGRAAQLQQQGKWAESLRLYQRSLLTYPESSALNDASDRFFLQRDRFERKLLLEQRMLRARNIPAERDNLESLASMSEPGEYQQQLQRLDTESQSIAEALLTEGQRELAQKNWRKAHELLELSSALRDDERTRTALRLAQAQLDAGRNQTPAPASPARATAAAPTAAAAVQPARLETPPSKDSPAIKAALHRYRYALQNKDLLGAQKQLSEAIELDPGSKKLAREQRQLQKQINDEVEQQIQRGKYQYSLGDIEKAIEHWEIAYKLAPDNEALKERLVKARRIRDRYEQLKQ